MDIRRLYIFEDSLRVPGDGSYYKSCEFPVVVAKKAAGEIADALLLVCLTDARNDKSHPLEIACIKEICAACGLPVIAGGNIERTEDVKKLLYAGCDAVLILPKTLTAEPVTVDEGLAGECQKRFGEDRVFLIDSIDDAEEVISAFVDKRRLTPAIAFADLKKNEQGLVPVTVTDDATNEVLMLAYMNEDAYDRTFKTGLMHYFSRERQRLWKKGEESGHFQYVKRIDTDCDKDTLLARVRQIGAACHTGSRSCFFNEIAKISVDKKNIDRVLQDVYDVISDRRKNPREGSYTNYLFDKGADKILKKLGEESTEIVIAAKNKDNPELTYEIADYLYHLMVLMNERELSWEAVLAELAAR